MEPELVANLESAPVRGRYSPEDALRQALGTHALELIVTDSGALSLRRAPPRIASEASAVTLPAVKVQGERAGASGLPPTYAGGHVASGARVGPLGNRDVMDTPFSQTSYTQQLIEDQQARTLADVLVNDPSIAIAARAAAGKAPRSAAFATTTPQPRSRSTACTESCRCTRPTSA